MSFIEEKGLENGKNGFEGRPLLYNSNLFVYSWSGRFYFYWGKVREFLETDVCCNHYYLEVQYSTFFPFNFLVYFCIQSTGNTDNEDICYEFKQEQDLIHRTHLYYMDYDFSPVSIQSVMECSTKKKQLFLSVLTEPCLFIQIIKFLQIWGLFINWYKKKIFSNICLVSPAYSPIACLLTKWV